MSDQNFGFGKFVPGFDFLQNLAKGASQTLPQMPSLSNWVAPTLNLEEVEKRIGELKAVHFWLDQNSRALAATIQALEVQKMTLATLKGMNFSMEEMAESLKLKPAAAAFGGAQSAGKQAAPTSSEDAAANAPKTARKKGAASGDLAAGGVIDPLQWWGALTQQFQQIAADAMKDAAPGQGRKPAAAAPKGAGGTARKATAQRSPKKPPR
jgi:hypothetical protein